MCSPIEWLALFAGIASRRLVGHILRKNSLPIRGPCALFAARTRFRLIDEGIWLRHRRHIFHPFRRFLRPAMDEQVGIPDAEFHRNGALFRPPADADPCPLLFLQKISNSSTCPSVRCSFIELCQV